MCPTKSNPLTGNPCVGIYYDAKRLEPHIVKNNTRKRQGDRSHSSGSLGSDNRAHVARPKENGFRACDMNVAITSSSGTTTHSDVTDDSDAEADDGGRHYRRPRNWDSWSPADNHYYNHVMSSNMKWHHVPM